MGILKKISQKIILDSVLFLFMKEIKGKDNLPVNESYIVASNHASNIDPFLIAAVVFKKHGRIVRYIGKEEVLNNFFGRFIYKTFGVIPIGRNSNSEKVINEAVKMLKNNEIIGIFPEATRTFDGNIQKGRTGVARLALLSKTKVIPIAIKNTYSLWPRHKKFSKFKKIVKINIGKPIKPKRSYTKDNVVSKEELRQLTDAVMKKIRHLYSNLK